MDPFAGFEKNFITHGETRSNAAISSGWVNSLVDSLIENAPSRFCIRNDRDGIIVKGLTEGPMKNFLAELRDITTFPSIEAVIISTMISPW